MTEMTPLRRRMVENMTVRNLSPVTQRSYLHAVAKFGRFFSRSPDKLDLEDVRTFADGPPPRRPPVIASSAHGLKSARGNRRPHLSTVIILP